MAHLVVIENGTIGREFPLKEGICHIGRWDPENSIYPEIDLTDEDIDYKISRNHAKIFSENSEYFIEDCNSSNKTFLNNSPTPLIPNKPCPINNEDEIKLGNIVFKFYI